MPTTAVTGATGHLGRLVVASLRAQGADVVALVRDPAKAAEVLGRDVETRVASYDDRAALEAALAGVDVLVLVSGSEVGQRVRQHTTVVEAARAAGVARVVYTSAPHADTTPLVLAPEHKATEEVIVGSGLAFTILRNNWYHENYADQVSQAAESGVLLGSAHGGRTASAARQDYAEAAAAVALGAGHDDRVYELAGDVAWTRPELAAAITEVTGSPVEYRDLSTDEHVAALTAAGLDEATAGFVAALDANTAEGTLADTSTGDLRRLIGRPTTPLVDGLRAATAA
ncbi:NAD(P)H dehydrogenase (quinone) [Friedmanniella luteola]|uniref:NAD(P)H dehydrogenase (Quinone) n=1 Tax=Friedmanniella luteola TaxID=546871 RepID=A0A1H1XVV8_9ACTN|nr:NmrA family NAD(P)-binding protein [Friedmanniella luteola]SDT12906.1 NAD(P)H dehydrogenase (quinone) [Friedmanniella luteola]